MAVDATKGNDCDVKSPPLLRVVSLILSFMTLIVGTALPVLTGPRVATASVNIIWGSIYGLGFWVLSTILPENTGVISFIITIFGVILWPLLILWLVYIIYTAVLRYQSTPIIVLITLLFLLSLSWNAEIDKVRQSFVYYLPLYSAFMDR